MHFSDTFIILSKSAITHRKSYGNNRLFCLSAALGPQIDLFLFHNHFLRYNTITYVLRVTPWIKICLLEYENTTGNIEIMYPMWITLFAYNIQLMKYVKPNFRSLRKWSKEIMQSCLVHYILHLFQFKSYISFSALFGSSQSNDAIINSVKKNEEIKWALTDILSSKHDIILFPHIIELELNNLFRIFIIFLS